MVWGKCVVWGKRVVLKIKITGGTFVSKVRCEGVAQVGMCGGQVRVVGQVCGQAGVVGQRPW